MDLIERIRKYLREHSHQDLAVLLLKSGVDPELLVSEIKRAVRTGKVRA